MAQRITRLTTDQKIAGSNPAGIDLFHYFFFFINYVLPNFKTGELNLRFCKQVMTEFKE